MDDGGRLPNPPLQWLLQNLTVRVSEPSISSLRHASLVPLCFGTRRGLIGGYIYRQDSAVIDGCTASTKLLEPSPTAGSTSCMSPAEQQQQQQQRHGECKKLVKAVCHLGLCLPPGGTPCCHGERPQERGHGPRPWSGADAGGAARRIDREAVRDGDGRWRGADEQVEGPAGLRPDTQQELTRALPWSLEAE